MLELHPHVQLTGLDESPQMLDHARSSLPAGTELHVARLQDDLPAGPFDLVFSALTVHHLDPEEKTGLFRRVAEIVRPGGRFVLGDVVVPEHDDDAVTPLTEGFDLPDPAEDQIRWLAAAGFDPCITWSWKDLVVISAQL